jgi:hypothetical protein
MAAGAKCEGMEERIADRDVQGCGRNDAGGGE